MSQDLKETREHQSSHSISPQGEADAFIGTVSHPGSFIQHVSGAS